MTKKLISALLIGSVVFNLAACGKESGSQQPQNPPLQAQEQAGGPAKSTVASHRSVFKDSVFLGDSITEGLSFHDVLDEANVLAGAGKTAEFALMDIDELTKRSPKQIIIQLGSDDILWPTDDPKAYSLAHYAALIGLIKDRLPEAKITLLSVTPVTAEREKKEPRYKKISDYNQGLKELADKEQVGFVDLSPIVADHSELYDGDGIHFQAEFYPFMLDALKDAVK
ncbi:GDSL-type esterase/lipase family protein [Paenibacillus thiaminolyticus]|uniref:GDSL-type esterase/lipase family protein n=1 Tax=Paenibacillus thiaminolyticus TaxID=49283 RepID=UPI003D2A500E